MRQLNPFLEFEDMPEFEIDAAVLQKNSAEADMLNKRGYRIKKPVWNGLIAS